MGKKLKKINKFGFTKSIIFFILFNFLPAVYSENGNGNFSTTTLYHNLTYEIFPFIKKNPFNKEINYTFQFPAPIHKIYQYKKDTYLKILTLQIL